MKKRTYQNALSWMLMAIALFTVSCNDDDEKKEQTLYDRLGGTDAISLVVDKFLTNVASDNVINARFSATIADQERAQQFRSIKFAKVVVGHAVYGEDNVRSSPG